MSVKKFLFTLVIVIILVIALVLSSVFLGWTEVDARHKQYYPQVVEARQWLKPKMSSPRQWRCLDQLWHNESHWRVRAENPYTGAYGIPQALPGKKMRKYGKRWRTRAMPQVKWGLNYVRARYGTACKALRHQDTYGWY